MLGDLSASYESNGDPGAISSGEQDPGGKSYGAYQLASKVGSLERFLAWMRNNTDNVTRQYGEALAKYELTSEAFDAMWREIAALDGETFFMQQHRYIEAAYYRPAAGLLAEAAYNVEQNHYDVMRDVVWSRAVQYGAGQVVEMFEEAVHALGYPNLSYVDARFFDASIIRAVYLNVCHTEEWTTPLCREGLYARFEAEVADALERLHEEADISDS